MDARRAHQLSLVFSLTSLLLCGFSSSLRAQQTLDDELKLYDRDDIHSIHKKLYTKEDRHELSLGFGGILNQDQYLIATAGYTYHLFESLGLEAAMGGLGFQLNDDNRLGFYQASAAFSPLYGKVSLFTWAVMNFDIYAVGGLGWVSYSGLRDGSSLMGNVGFGQRFFINEFLSFKVEFRDYIYNRKVKTGTEAQNNFALSGALSVLIPFRQAY